MPQLAASYVFNSPDPNFTRDQVQTLEELYTYGGWNEGDSRYPNESSLTKIDLGHVTFVVETNKHYTYIKINELDGENNIIGHHYGWVEFNAIGAESSGQGGQGGGGGELSVYAYFKSLVFKRGPVSPAPATPEGGDFSHPVPEGWSDGVPAVTITGEEAIWMSTRVFSSGGAADTSFTSEWTAPTLIADTEWKDFEFSELETLDSEHAEPNKQYPSDVATNGWSNTATEDTIWMAMRDVEAGAYKQGSRWEIVKIKGEDGEQAFKIKILGKLTNIDDLEAVPNPQYLDAYIIGNNVYVYDGDSWEDSGPFRGEYDSSKDWAYLHVKYSDDGGQSFTAFGGEVPGKWVGTYCDYLIQDSNNIRDYFWKAVGGGDGFGYEYIYRLTIDDEAPDVPDDHTNSNGDDWQSFDFVPNNWSDDPGRIDSTWRWCWVCHRVCINGVWGEFKGAHGKTAAEGGKAALYAHYGSDAVASSASRNFMIFTWTALNSTLENPAPYVPVKPEDNVAKWNVLDNTLDLNEGQSWTWENEGQSGVWNVNPGNAQGKFLWMSTASFSEALEGQIVGHWSDPVRLTGDDGRNGTDGVDTAFGYRLCDNMEEFAALTAPTLSDPYDEDSFADSRWKDHPTGISPAHPIEAAAVGIFNKETLTWSYGAPFIWARWGEDGIDGDGVEYLFYIATEEDVVKSDILDEGDNKIGENIDLENLNWLPTTEAQLSEFLGGDDEKINSFYHDHYNEWLPEGTGWTDDPSDVGPFQPYEFVSIRRFQYDEVAKEGKWGLWSEPALWAKYSKDGKAGRSVFTSMAFTRTTIDLSGTKPKGGTVEQPVPTSTWSSSSESATEVEGITWYDTVPSDSNAPVWMTSRIFDDSLTGEGTGWKSPTKLQDTPEFQVEYTDEEVWDTTALPSLNDYIDFANFPYEGINEGLWRQDALDATGAHWGDIGDPDDPNSTDIVDPWWMITARRDHNGVWSKWAIHKIKGEKGQPGTSISVKGSLDSYIDLGDPSGDPAGRVDHSTISLGDCYVINGLLWIYDDNSTKTSPYSTDYVTDPTGTGQIQGNKYAGFSCQGQFKGDPGSNSWIHVRFANKSDDQSTAITDETKWYRYFYNSEVFIEFTGNSHSGIVPGKYAGIAITHDVNIAPTSILDYEWTEWRGDDIYGTEQIFTLAGERPETPTRPSNVTEADWFTFDYVPTVPISGTDPVEYQVWSDTPLEATPDAHCWVSTRRLSDPEDNGWNTPVIYSRYAHDGDNGIDGAVNEFAYHLGDRNDAPEINRAKAKQYAIENGRPESIINDVAGQEGVSSAAAWWASDASRDYCPADFDNGYWTDNPQGVADEDGQRVEYYIYRTREYDDEHNQYVWSDWSPVKVWSSWGQKGHDGDGVEYIFTLTKIFKTPSNPTPYTEVSGETVIDTETVDGDNHSWFDYDYAPTIPVAADYDPEDSEFTEHQWYDDPQEINSTWRYQWVSMRRSHSDSEGNAQWSEFSNPVEWNRYTEDGKDGRTEEFVYYLSKYGSDDKPIKPKIDSGRAHKVIDGVDNQRTGLTQDDWQELVDWIPGLLNPEDFGDRFPDTSAWSSLYWSDNPLAISEEWPIEYMSSRFKKDGIWSEWSDPIPWSTWGKTGHDGDGVEYIFARTANKDVVPVLSNETGAFTDNNSKTWADDDFLPRTSIPGTDPVEYLDWTDDPQGTTKDLRVEWVSIRKTYEGVWAPEGDRKCWSDPKIWNEYDDSLLEERVYHYGGKTDDPVLNQVRNYRGQITNSSGETLQQLDGFIPSDVPPEATTGYYDGEGDFDPNGWSPLPKGITPENRYEYEAIRKKNPETGVWGQFNGPYLYAAWGEDGDSVEFVFWMLTSDQHSVVQTTHQNGGVIEPYGIENDSYDSGTHNPSEAEYRPQITIGSSNLRAQDDPSDLTSEKPYLYASKRTKRNGEWGDFCDIFLYSQLVLEPEYSCTLDLEEDTQGVSVEEIEGDKFKALKKSNGIGLTDMELRYGASAMIVGKVWVAPLVWNKSEGKYQRGSDILVWDVTVNDGASTTTNISIPTYVGSSDINTIRFSINRADTFYNAWFSWGATDLIFDKDSDGNPRDINFIIRAGGSTTEGETNKTGEATFKIRPSVGDTVYEIDPWYNLFKKGTTGNNPFSQQSLPFYLYKNQVETGKNWLNKSDWDTNGHLSVRYKVDQLDVPDSSATWVTASGTFGNNDTIKESSGNDNKWTLKQNVYHEGLQDEEPYVLLTIFLYKSESGTKTSLIGDPVDGITVQFLNDGWVSDEEYIPVVYNGKDGKRGDYYKEETAYFLSQSDQVPSAPADDVVLVTPSGTDSNDADKWLDTPVSPTTTYRYLYAAKRLNRYWGDNDPEREAAVNTISEAGTWETPFLFASRSVGENGDPGRGIASVDEYYMWTETETPKPTTSTTGWVHNNDNSVPTRGTDDKWLWNYEVVHYINPTGTETTGVELVGSVGDDGRGIDSITEYYFWSANLAGTEGTYNPSNPGSVAYPSRSTVNSGSTNAAKLASWWDASSQTELNAQAADKSRCYLWNFERITFDDGSTPHDSVPARIGSMPRNVEGIAEYYQWSSSGTTAPSTPTITETNLAAADGNVVSGWKKNQIPERTTEKYLWNFEVISYSYGNLSQTPAEIASSIGDDGRGIASIVDYYFWSHLNAGDAGTYDATGTIVAYPSLSSLSNTSTTWCDTLSTDHRNTLNGQISNSRKYLWNFEVTTYDDPSASTSSSVPAIIAINGEIGNGISTVQEYYLWTTASTLTSTQTSHANATNPANSSYTDDTRWRTAWYASPNNKTYRYLWNFEVISYTTDPNPYRTSPALIGTIGEDGRGISSVTEYYLWSDKNVVGQIPAAGNSSWKTVDQLSTPTGDQKYLWNYEAVVYTDSSTPVNSTPIIISVKGDKGDDGKYSQFVYFRSKSDLSSLTYSQVTSGSSPVLYTFTGSGEKVPVFKYGSYYISPNSDDVEGTVSSTYTARPSGSPFYVTSSNKAYITDDPLGVNDDWRYEYESMGTMDDNGNWIFSKPALHNYKATDGQSGNTRVELFKVSATLNTAPTLSNNEATRDALVADGWMPLGIALNAGQALGVSDYDIWMIYATYAGDGSEDSLAKVWVGPSLYNAIRKGEPGDSITGPAVRGPVEWTNASRRWCAGKDSTPVSSQNHAEDVAWIDVVTYNGSYYVCKQSHTGPQTPSDSSNYWDKDTTGKYKFIAAEVLVADAGAIDVLKSGSLLLRDNSDNVVGGAKGTDSATGTIFWAGGTYSNGTISGAPFVVNKAGAMTSSSGTVGGWTINPDSLSATGSQAWNSAQNKFMPELPKLSITTTRTSSVSTVNMSVSLRDSGITGTYSSTPKSSSSLGSYSGTFNLDPQMLSFSGNYSSDTSVKDYTTTLTYSDITFDSSYDTQGTQFEDFLNISSVNGIQLRQKVDGSIYKEARLTKDRLEIESVYASSSIASSGDISSAGTISALDGFTITDYARPRSVTSSIGMLPLRIAIVVDDFSTAQSMFSDSGTTWKFNGGDTGVSTSEYPTLSTSSLPTGGTQVVYLTSSSVHLGTGVVLKTNLTRVGNTIYIEI